MRGQSRKEAQSDGRKLHDRDVEVCFDEKRNGLGFDGI